MVLPDGGEDVAMILGMYLDLNLVDDIAEVAWNKCQCNDARLEIVRPSHLGKNLNPQYLRWTEDDDGETIPNTSLTLAFSNLTRRLDRCGMEFHGTLNDEADESKHLVQAIVSAYSFLNLEGVRYLGGLLVSKQAFDRAFINLVAEYFDLTEPNSLLE